MDSKLSYDMKIEILSRTSLNTLHAVRCTNKGFNKLTYDSNLLNMKTMVSGLIIQNITSSNEFKKEFIPWSPESNSLDLGFLPDNARIVASSEQGVMVLETRPQPRMVLYHVCKPTTKQLLKLPYPKLMYKTVMTSIVVICSKPLHYRILRLSQPENPGLQWQGTYCGEIFDSVTHEWTLLDLLVLPQNVFLTDPAITTRGSIYILLSNNDVLKFDSYLEKWTTFSSPNQSSNVLPRRKPKLLKYQGQLGVICKPLHGFWEIWVLKIDESWEKVCVLDKEEDTVSLETSFDSNTTVSLDSNIILFYHFRVDGNLEKTDKLSLHSKTFFFQSDFEDLSM